VKVKISSRGAFYIKNTEGFCKIEGLCCEPCSVRNTLTNTTDDDMWCIEALSSALGNEYFVVGVLKNKIIANMFLEWVWVKMECCNHFIDVKDWDAAKGFVDLTNCEVVFSQKGEDGCESA